MDTTNSHAFDPDLPLTDPKDDRLKRDGFSQELAKHIGSWRGKESIVIGINGNWGTGKSTVKNFIKHHLSSRDSKPTMVEFNPWEWSGQNKLLEGFLSEIGIALGKKDKAKQYKDLAKKWNRFASYVKFTATLGDVVKNIARGIFGTSAIGAITALSSIQAIGPWPLIVAGTAAAITGAVAFIPKLLEIAVKVFSDHAALHDKSIEEVKADLTQAMKGLETPVVVFIDDVDRLTDEEAKILFQLVKANCQFPNLIYVILFEREVVEEALSKIVSGGGKRYLRKIVQHSFDLPHPSRAMLSKLFSEELDKAIFKSGIRGIRWNSERWRDNFADDFYGWFPSLRDAKRYMGSLRFALSRHSPGGVLEVDPIDLVVIEALRTMHYQVFRSVAGGFHAKSGMLNILFGQEEINKSFNKQVESIITSYSNDPDSKDSIRRALEGLFPQANANYGDHDGSEENWLRDRRVCHSKHFNKYFQLSLEENEISALLIDEIIAASGDRSRLNAIFSTAINKSKSLDLFEAIFVSRDLIPTQNLAPFITALFDIGDILPDDAAGTLLMDAEMTCIRIIHHRLKVEPIQTVADVLRLAYSETTGVVLPVRYYALEDKRSRKSSESRVEFLLPESTLTEFQELALGLIRKRAENYSLLDLDKCAAIIFRWRDWGKPSEVSIWISSVICKPGYALKLLLRLLSTSYSSRDGKEYFLSAKSLESIVNLERLREKIDSCFTPSLSDDEKQAIELLDLAIARKNEGKPYDEIRLKEDW